MKKTLIAAGFVSLMGTTAMAEGIGVTMAAFDDNFLTVLRNGIQAHQDMFTSLATAAGVPDVVERVKTEKKQYIDGVNNIDYWTGKSEDSARNHIFHYYESKLMAVRMGPPPG